MAEIPAVSQKNQNIIVRINKVEATIRNVEKAVQDANDLLNGDQSWDTIGHKWVKGLIDSLEELKKDLREQVKELREEYKEDVEALKVALRETKQGAKEVKTDVQEMAQKMGEMQKVIDGLVAAREAGMARPSK